jgi:hypothetical protein
LYRNDLGLVDDSSGDRAGGGCVEDAALQWRVRDGFDESLGSNVQLVPKSGTSKLAPLEERAVDHRRVLL